MLRTVLGIAFATTVAVMASCQPPVPKPLDTSAIPSARTSAEPLYVSNQPPETRAPASATATATPSAAPAVSAVNSAGW